MIIKNDIVVKIDPNEDTFILATWEGKLAINGPFIDLLCMTLGVINELYLKGTDANKKMLKEDLPIIIKKLAENNFDIDKLNL